jgi:hypothetical protein
MVHRQLRCDHRTSITETKGSRWNDKALRQQEGWVYVGVCRPHIHTVRMCPIPVWPTQAHRPTQCAL